MATNHLSIRDDSGELEGYIEDYQRANGAENKSEAIRELLRIGYTESQRPIVYRLKELSIFGGAFFVLLSLVPIPFGAVTSLLTWTQTAWLVTSLVVMGVLWVAAIELVRAIAGGGELRWPR